MESCYSRGDKPLCLRSCFLEKFNQNVKQWYFLNCAVSSRLTIGRSFWHVRHIGSMHVIKDMCISFGFHKPNWVFRFLYITNSCFQCKCYFSLMLYTALCLWNMILLIRMAIKLIWFDLINWKATYTTRTTNHKTWNTPPDITFEMLTQSKWRHFHPVFWQTVPLYVIWMTLLKLVSHPHMLRHIICHLYDIRPTLKTCGWDSIFFIFHKMQWPCSASVICS